MRSEIEVKFANMWQQSRYDAGKSQEYMAQKLGVSKKTVQNWECGLSCPSQVQGFEWFDILGLQPLPYYLKLLYPEMDALHPKSASGVSDQAVDDAICKMLRDLPIDAKRKILYIAYGDHGSSPFSILEMVVAHLHVPLIGRLNIAQNILTNYELAKAKGSLIGVDHIQPNIAHLFHAFEKGKEAVKLGLNGYTSIDLKGEEE